ncbi:MAG TPA: T9SS type A sorting domain-containing protein, partial [bacterium]|nr:T9SS type A sorting domain-containing protein [bacterium]
AGIALTDSLATSGLAPVIGITHANNVVVAWNASGTGPGWIAARKFSPAGTPLWSTPFRVRDPAGTIGYTRPSWLPAGPDETLLFYIEQTGRFPFTSHVFAQRLSPAAQPQWTAPLNISTSLPFTFFPTPVPDGQGGAYLVYNAGNPANLTLTTVFAQHLLPAGSTAWGPDGVELLTGTSSVRFAAEAAPAVPSAAGELTVILTEQNVSQSTAGLTLQRLDAAGNRLFGPSGRVLLTPSSDLTRAAGLRGAGAGKSIVVFTTGGGLTQAISALGLDAAGNPAWTATPTRLISAAISGKDDLSLLPVRDGQLVVVWADDRRGGGPGTNGIYAQSIDMSGRLGGSVPTAAPLMADALPLPVIWPNPASEASLHLPTATPLPVILSLHDATGRLTYQRSHELSPDRSALRLPAELPAGLYHITLSVPSRQYHLRWLKL